MIASDRWLDFDFKFARPQDEESMALTIRCTLRMNGLFLCSHRMDGSFGPGDRAIRLFLKFVGFAI